MASGGTWAVHYATHGDKDTLCGRYVLAVTSTNQWDDVTCKRCHRLLEQAAAKHRKESARA